MNIDVSAEIEIAANPADIAAIMFDPAREKDWLQAVREVELIDPALAPGAKVRHRGTILGHDVSWLSEVEAVHFPHVLTLRISDGPFVGTVRYEIQRSSAGSRARVRSVGTPTAKLRSRIVRRSNAVAAICASPPNRQSSAMRWIAPRIAVRVQ